jgi:uncharacterized membrane protein
VRYASIDVVRAAAILLMIQVHFSDNLSSRGEGSAWLYDISGWLGLVPAPLFTFVAGVSYGLWLRKQVGAGRSDEEITKVTVRRGLFLFAAGIAFNALVWLPEDTYNWDILTLIGTALVLLAFLRKLPAAPLVVLCVMLAAVAPLLRAAGDYPAYWHDQEYHPDLTLEDVALGFLANGYFPVFPWLAFPILGFVVGDAVYGDELETPRWVLVTGAGLLAASLLLALVRPHLPAAVDRTFAGGYTMFPATLTYLLATAGLAMVSVAVFHSWLDSEPAAAPGPVERVIRRFSTFSLTVYVLHHAAHLWPLWIYGNATVGDPTHYWRHAMSTPWALGWAAVFVVLCYFLLGWLERHPHWSLEGLMRWLCD